MGRSRWGLRGLLALSVWLVPAGLAPGGAARTPEGGPAERPVPPQLPAGPVPPPACASADPKKWLAALEERYPDRCRVVQLAVTSEGRDVCGLEVRPQSIAPAGMQRCAVICGQHGDEPDGRDAGVELLDRVLNRQTLRTWQVLSCTALLVVPCANPDGAAHCTRANSRGQDPNRDWGVGRTAEVRGIQSYLAGWAPHLVVDVHQWVPGDVCQEPMAVARGGRQAARAAVVAAGACATHGFSISTAPAQLGASLCTAYYGGRPPTQAILLETRHVPGSTCHQESAVRTTVVSLLRVLDLMAEAGPWSDPAVMPFCGPENEAVKPAWYTRFASRVRSLDRPGIVAQVWNVAGQPGATWRDDLARCRVALEGLDYETAFAAAQAAYFARPSEADTAFMYGATIYFGRDVGQSLPYFDWAVKRAPKHQGARLYLARCHELAGHPKDAAKLYESLWSERDHLLSPYRRYVSARRIAAGRR